MVAGGGGAAFPVVFFDGQQEVDIGRMRVNPMMEFKNFQFTISRRIGISPNQISIYLCNRKSDRKKTPITGKVNFEFIVACEKDCFILAVLKRSRKSARRRRPRVNWMEECEDLLWESQFAARSPPVGNLILLRRNQPEFHVSMMNPADPVLSGFRPPQFDQISQAELAGLNNRLQDLNIHKQNYAMAMARSNPDPSPNPKILPHPDPTSLDDPEPSSGPDPNGLPDIEEIYSAMTENYIGKCEECGGKKKKKNGEPTAFHPCPDDPVIRERFRTRVGPIGRSSL
ncbi:unnamed protein product [Cuscuta campestris]|uniref:DUF7138 domain-containing protein n=1 Tax=Cuscuta campestris TaxID=132261 RepID=A0A484LDL1_9ASTE|nr:unnamed protein product [Cuscuta campestris]